MAETNTSKNLIESSNNSTGSDRTGWTLDPEETPVLEVVSAVAETLDKDPFELPPLNDAVDPDALNSLFTSRPESGVNRVEFEYAGCMVSVKGDGTVHVSS